MSTAKVAMKFEGAPASRVLAELDAFTSGDADWRTGRILTGLYDAGGDALRGQRRAVQLVVARGIQGQ